VDFIVVFDFGAGEELLHSLPTEVLTALELYELARVFHLACLDVILGIGKIILQVWNEAHRLLFNLCWID
jgi:hypothetical protein